MPASRGIRESSCARWLAVAAMVTLAGCSNLPSGGGGPVGPHPDIAQIPNAVPHRLPRSPYGNPPSYSVFGKTYYVLNSAEGYVGTGIASWYGRKFQGQRTSSGEPYDMFAMTAAHKTLPLPTFVRVTNLRNGRQVVVKVNDRGPFHPGRIIDLSYAAAWKLGMLKQGSAPVRVEAIDAVPLRIAQSSTAAAPAPVMTVAASTPVADPPPAPVPEASTADVDQYLQVGAFADPANARTLAARLRAAGLPQTFVDPPRNGETYYRVRLGPFSDRVALVVAEQRLQALNIAFTIVSPESGSR